MDKFLGFITGVFSFGLFAVIGALGAIVLIIGVLFGVIFS